VYSIYHSQFKQQSTWVKKIQLAKILRVITLKVFTVWVSEFKNLSGFFFLDFLLVKISPEWFTGPKQGTSSGKTATFSQGNETRLPDWQKELWQTLNRLLDTWVRTDQQVAQLHDGYMIIMMMMMMSLKIFSS
jgi:hypothetical protein